MSMLAAAYSQFRRREQHKIDQQQITLPRLNHAMHVITSKKYANLGSVHNQTYPIFAVESYLTMQIHVEAYTIHTYPYSTMKHEPID